MQEGIGRVLIVSGNDKGAEFIENMLTQFGPETVVTLHAGTETRRILLDGCTFDYVFINMPLPDETGADLARRIAEGEGTVMALIKGDTAEQIGYSLARSGIYTMPKPVTRTGFVCGMYMMMASRAHIDEYRNKNEKLQLKIDENSIISRAKCLLIEKRSMSEQDAHTYIEKQAMNARKTKREIADAIINTYEEDAF